MKRLPPVTSSSTILVTVTSPIRHLDMRLPPVLCRVGRRITIGADVGGDRFGPAHRLLRLAELAVDASWSGAHRGSGGDAWRHAAHLSGGFRHCLRRVRRPAAAEAGAATSGLSTNGAASL